MTDVIFFLIFACILSMIGLDEAVVQLLESTFHREFSLFYYYALFALLGLGSWLVFQFQKIIHRD
jgi:hypothetical protein